MKFIMRIASLCLCVSLLLIITLTSFASDLTISGQNDLRYGRGKPVGNEQLDTYAYFENYLDLNASFKDYRFYLRQSYLLPSIPEYGGRHQAGLAAFNKWYIEYSGDQFKVRGGDFYRTWGHGLLFGTVEYLDLGFDTGLEGVLLEGYQGGFEGAVFRGTEIDTAGTVREEAEGAWVSYRVPDELTRMDVLRFGGSVSRLENGPRHPLINRSGFEMDAELGSISLSGVYVSDKVDYDLKPGYYNGTYGSVSTYGSIVDEFTYGLSLGYKNYNLFTYNDPTQGAGLADQPPLLFPPTGIPEATMYLLDRHPRILYLGDDVGWQLELTGNYYDWDIFFNANQASRKKNGNGLIPSLDEQYSPYQAVFIKVTRDNPEGDLYAIQAGAHQDVQFVRTPVGGFSTWFERIGGGGIYTHRINDTYSMTADVELLGGYEKRVNRRYDDQYLAVSLSRSPDITVVGVMERSNDNIEIGGSKSGSYRYWPSAEVTYNFMQRHQLRLFGGHERGGLKCTGGVCREVTPFKGVKVSLVSQF